MNSKLTCICLDDELPALKLLENYSVSNPHLDLKNTFNNALDALDFVTKNPVDLAIMDIQMPSLNGVEFFKKINHTTLGLFISANPNFAHQAFEIDIIDFILKPATRQRFDRGILKVLDFYNLKNKANQQYIKVKEGYLSHKINLTEINFVEGAGEYIKIITPLKTYMLFKRLKEFEEENRQYGFIRIHKSYIVPLNNLASGNFSSVKLKSGQSLPLGRLYKYNLPG